MRTTVHIFCIAIFIIGCDDTASHLPQPTPQITAPTKAEDKRVNLNMIELYDLEMKRLSVSALTGDTRPYYQVSGRMLNKTGITLTSVTIRIYLESTEKIIDNREVYDKVDVQISGPIFGGTKGFSQEIQVLPPKGKRWTFIPVVVDAKRD